MSEEQQQPTFGIERIYVKDLSLESPGTPESFLDRGEAPRVEVEFATEARNVAEGLYEAVLHVTVKAVTSSATLFLVEVAQGGLFQIRNLPEEALDPTLGIACPNILYPYAREVVSDATSRAGFSPVVLQPVNFEQIYMAAREQAAQQAQQQQVQ